MSTAKDYWKTHKAPGMGPKDTRTKEQKNWDQYAADHPKGFDQKKWDDYANAAKAKRLKTKTPGPQEGFYPTSSRAGTISYPQDENGLIRHVNQNQPPAMHININLAQAAKAKRARGGKKWE